MLAIVLIPDAPLGLPMVKGVTAPVICHQILTVEAESR